MSRRKVAKSRLMEKSEALGEAPSSTPSSPRAEGVWEHQTGLRAQKHKPPKQGLPALLLQATRLLATDPRVTQLPKECVGTLHPVLFLPFTVEA